MNNVQVGIGVIIIKENRVLMGVRINSHGQNSWGFPGGHLEFGETP
jgi:8-oxo-dGTP diphosphatase